MSDELERLMARVHPGLGTFAYRGTEVPSIILEGRRFDEIISQVAGKATSVDTDLNILQDGLGHIFVEIAMKFSVGEIVEKILIDATVSLKFFELLAETSMLALSSPDSASGGENVFMIQLPRPERVSDALEIIRKGLKKR